MSVALEKIMKMRAPSGDVGVEVEVEFNGGVAPPGIHEGIPNWVVKTDGSLRGGFEFVSRQPFKMSADLKEKKLDPLFAIIAPRIQKGAIRASTHVHVNALRLTPIEVMNTATLWWLVEDLMMSFCGDERKTNRFCAPINTSSGFFASLLDRFSNGDVFNKNAQEIQDRYFALNFAALTRFGSIEYRGMRALHDGESVFNWMRTVHRLQLDLGRQHKNPLSIADKFLNSKDKKEFIKNIIGPYIKIDVDDEAVSMVEDQLLYIYPWIVLTDNWKDWEDDIIARSSKKKEESVTVGSTTTGDTTVWATGSREFSSLQRWIVDTDDAI